MFLGKRLKEARITKNMLQAELAEAVGITKVSVCNYEKGRRIPSLPILIKIIEVLEVSADFLLGQDIQIVSETEKKYSKIISKEELVLLTELRKNRELYNKVLKDPVRSIKILKFNQTN